MTTTIITAKLNSKFSGHTDVYVLPQIHTNSNSLVSWWQEWINKVSTLAIIIIIISGLGVTGPVTLCRMHSQALDTTEQLSKKQKQKQNKLHRCKKYLQQVKAKNGWTCIHHHQQQQQQKQHHNKQETYQHNTAKVTDVNQEEEKRQSSYAITI